MPVGLNDMFGIHENALALRARRTEVLANNLANADTPNFKARDMDFKQALAEAQSQSQSNAMTVNTTRGAHMQPVSDPFLDHYTVYRVPTQPSLDGNTVDTQIEQAEFAKNAIQYQASLTFLNAKISNILTAIRGE